MALGKYHIQYRYDFDPPEKWRTDLQLQYLGKDFARGAFFAIKQLCGGNRSYRLVKSNYAPQILDRVEVIDTHNTGEVKLN